MSETASSPTPLSDAALAELDRLAAAASRGPWEAASCNAVPACYLYGPAPVERDDPPGLMRASPPLALRCEDALFVAAARTAVPLLIAEVRRLRDLLLEACCPLCGVPWAVGVKPSEHAPDCEFADGRGRAAAGGG